MYEQHPAKHVVDAVAGLTILGAIVQYLPAVAAVFAILWYAMQMYDMYRYKWKVKHSKARRKEDTSGG